MPFTGAGSHENGMPGSDTNSGHYTGRGVLCCCYSREDIRLAGECMRNVHY